VTTHKVCHCAVYPFPHRMGGAACWADDTRVFCGDCGLPCEILEGYSMEYMPYGDRRSMVKRPIRESDCCGGDILDCQAELIRRKVK